MVADAAALDLGVAARRAADRGGRRRLRDVALGGLRALDDGLQQLDALGRRRRRAVRLHDRDLLGPQHRDLDRLDDRGRGRNARGAAAGSAAEGGERGLVEVVQDVPRGDHAGEADGDVGGAQGDGARGSDLRGDAPHAAEGAGQRGVGAAPSVADEPSYLGGSHPGLAGGVVRHLVDELHQRVEAHVGAVEAHHGLARPHPDRPGGDVHEGDLQLVGADVGDGAEPGQGRVAERGGDRQRGGVAHQTHGLDGGVFHREEQVATGAVTPDRWHRDAGQDVVVAHGVLQPDEELVRRGHGGGLAPLHAERPLPAPAGALDDAGHVVDGAKDDRLVGTHRRNGDPVGVQLEADEMGHWRRNLPGNPEGSTQ